MTQQSLITRLKAVEEALVLGVGALEVEAANYHEAMKGYRHERHAAMDREVEQANAALSDLRDLIKEAEGQVETAVLLTSQISGDKELDWDNEGWSGCFHKQPLYTALGEKP